MGVRFLLNKTKKHKKLVRTQTPFAYSSYRIKLPKKIYCKTRRKIQHTK
jgi:hypothetical protein